MKQRIRAIVVTSLMVFLTIGLLALSSCTRSQIKEMVAESAAAYCDELQMDYLGGSSPGTDSDKDGYYSIDARCKGRTADAKEKLLNLECTISRTGMFATGCKQKVIVKTQ